MPSFQNKLQYLILFPILLTMASCASTKTYQYQYVEANEQLAKRDFAAASLIIEGYRDQTYKEKDRVLYNLDVGMLYHYAGEYEKSNAALSEAERGIEELYTKSISKMLTSGILNDNALDYGGEDYEDIYLNVFKGLNYIALGDPESALVEIRRIHIKLNILEDKYRKLIEEYNQSDEAEGEITPIETRFYNDALARYLGLLLYRYENSLDSARIERDNIEQAFKNQKQLYDFPLNELPELTMDRDMAHLSIIAFSGMAPRKLAETFYLTTLPGVVMITSASQSEEYVKSNVGFNFLSMPGIDGGFHFKFEYPRMDLMGSRANRIVLVLDGVPVKEIPLFEKMESISKEIFRIKQPLVIGKSILRTVTKGILKESAKDQMNEAGPMAGLLMGIALDVAVDATENADLRTSQYFPAYAHTLDIKIPAGEHTVAVEYYHDSTLLFRDNRGVMDLQAEELNLVESFVLE
jgi:hypothetical protein